MGAFNSRNMSLVDRPNCLNVKRDCRRSEIFKSDFLPRVVKTSAKEEVAELRERGTALFSAVTGGSTASKDAEC